MATGETAMLQLSALHANSTKVPVDRTKHQEARIATLKCRLEEHHPTFIVFCDTGNNRTCYEEIVGTFKDGRVWRGRTLCILVPHPSPPNLIYRPHMRAGSWWAEKGKEMHAAVVERLSGTTR
jgi:hypothetical protein